MTNAFVGAVQGVILAVIGLAQAFNIFSLTTDQNAAIMAAYGAVVTVIILLNTKFGKPATIRAAAASQGVDVSHV